MFCDLVQVFLYTQSTLYMEIADGFYKYCWLGSKEFEWFSMEILKYSYFPIYLCLKHHIFASYITESFFLSPPLRLFLD